MRGCLMDRVNSNAKESVKKSRHLTDAVTQREASEYNDPLSEILEIFEVLNKTTLF